MTIAVQDSAVLREKYQADETTYQSLRKALRDEASPLANKFRSIFALKNLGTERAIDIISEGTSFLKFMIYHIIGFNDSSALLKHEVAYVLGQMKMNHAIPVLESVLENSSEDPMVRHEAAEALGAIGNRKSLDILHKYLNLENESRVVKETCELAIAKICLEGSADKDEKYSNKFSSIDPAPAFEENESTVKELERILLDSTRPLFERYRAMFSLRNLGDTEAVLALSKGLQDESALFRHEIAYVFGQLQHPASVDALKKSLAREDEISMVRHECAEALGSIATAECLPILEKYKSDSERVVKESCEVALDMYNHEVSGDFQYASVE